MLQAIFLSGIPVVFLHCCKPYFSSLTSVFLHIHWALATQLISSIQNVPKICFFLPLWHIVPRGKLIFSVSKWAYFSLLERGIFLGGSNYAKWIVMLSSGGTLTSWNVLNASHLSLTPLPLSSYFTPEIHMWPTSGWARWQWLWSRRQILQFAAWTVFLTSQNCVIITHIVIRWLRCKRVEGMGH